MHDKKNWSFYVGLEFYRNSGDALPEGYELSYLALLPYNSKHQNVATALIRRVTWQENVKQFSTAEILSSIYQEDYQSSIKQEKVPLARPTGKSHVIFFVCWLIRRYWLFLYYYSTVGRERGWKRNRIEQRRWRICNYLYNVNLSWILGLYFSVRMGRMFLLFTCLFITGTFGVEEFRFNFVIYGDAFTVPAFPTRGSPAAYGVSIYSLPLFFPFIHTTSLDFC